MGLRITCLVSFLSCWPASPLFFKLKIHPSLFNSSLAFLLFVSLSTKKPELDNKELLDIYEHTFKDSIQQNFRIWLRRARLYL